MKPYHPIDCGFYDRLEAWAVKRVDCTIELEDGTVVEDLFEDFDNRPDGEFAVLASGTRIRLDRIARVNGIERPGMAC